jgi:hypothetical protein
VLSFGEGITNGEGCFGHFEVLEKVGFIWGFGDVAWDFDVFVHFNENLLNGLLVCHWDYYYIGGSYILKHYHNILPFKGLQL